MLRFLLSSVAGGGRTEPWIPSRAVRILVVEDEPAIADFIARGLEAEGHSVLVAATGTDGEREALAGGRDLVILDRMLPGRDGLDVLDAIRRARPELPVIMLTARGEIEDRVEGLDRGATDYLVKPFAFAELAARVRAHTRAPAPGSDSALEAGGIHLDPIRRTAQRGGVSTPLSARELDLLAALMRNAGGVVSREELLHSVWGYSHDPGTNVVQVYVGYLRRKLAREGLADPIETVRSVGYRLVDRG